MIKNEGKIVRLRFTHRIAETQKAGENIVVTIVYSDIRTASGGYIALTAPTSASKWAAQLSDKYRRGATEFVYARILSAKDGEGVALGREIKNGIKGPELVW